MSEKKQIVSMIQSIAGEYPIESVFSDWVKCMSIAYQNSIRLIRDSVWNLRENEYLQTIKKYNSKNQEKCCEMHALLVVAMEKEITDLLGQIYMELECGSKATGQFFTPFHLSQLMANIAFFENDKYIINEPSCGAGGMIIAFAKHLKDKGLNYQNLMRVTAQDLEWRSVYMTYVQMCILGINAVVIRADSLSGKKPSKESILYTPRKAGCFI